MITTCSIVTVYDAPKKRIISSLQRCETSGLTRSVTFGFGRTFDSRQKSRRTRERIERERVQSEERVPNSVRCCRYLVHCPGLYTSSYYNDIIVWVRCERVKYVLYATRIRNLGGALTSGAANV